VPRFSLVTVSFGLISLLISFLIHWSFDCSSSVTVFLQRVSYALVSAHVQADVHYEQIAELKPDPEMSEKPYSQARGFRQPLSQEYCELLDVSRRASTESAGSATVAMHMGSGYKVAGSRPLPAPPQMHGDPESFQPLPR